MQSQQTQFQITRQNVFVVAFFVLLIGLLSLLFSLLEPFLSSFVWATILALVFYPLYSKLLKLTNDRTTLSALLTTLVVLAFLALPGFFLTVNLAKELPSVYTFISSTQWDEKSQYVLDKLKSFNIDSWLKPWGIDPSQSEAVLQKQVAGALQDLSHLILEKVTYLFKNVAVFALHLAFVLVALFFFFRDGSRLSLKAIEFLPMEAKYREKVVETLSLTVTAVVRAIFLAACLQGFLAGLGFVVVGMPVPILLGLIAFVNAFIPFLGAASVWIPSACWLFYQDQTFAAVGLTLWGIVITLIDHVLRPWLIGSKAKLPIFWLFFTTIGGLKVYGVLGIFLGPIILSLGMAFLAIYRDVYLERNTAKPNPKRR